MNPWIGKAAFLLGLFVFVAIRVPHDKRSKEAKITESRKGGLEATLLALMGIGGFVLPCVFILSPLFSFADYALRLLPFSGGIVSLGFSFWLFHRSHADLGTNWSNSLELRENHQLVISGIYKSIRHPMYAAIFVYALAQALLLSNWVAGPGCLVAFVLMLVFRLRPEERMMLERFGQPYQDYLAKTKRLIPGIW
ncbi:MAG: protein-S-isoprenylcysteine O-methyltransferase [Terriglobia bacterium]|jgi:protein-S-isoprenylcysteine O-methyltransferase Ste14